MRRKKPEIGDIVRVPQLDQPCLVTSTLGIRLWVRPLDKEARPVYVRRDSVEIISRANS